MTRIEHLNGDCREVLKTLPDKSVHCCITSPPYFGLRDYGACDCGSGRFDLGQGDGTGGNLNYRAAQGFRADCLKCAGTGRVKGTEAQIGLEPTPDAYVAELVAVFREVRRVLRDDGTLWLNLGDSYGAVGGNTYAGFNERWSGTGGNGSKQDATLVGVTDRKIETGPRPKNLIGIPWRIAFALQADGWYLRQDIIWSKPNPMPESVRDRCTKAHEYLFLLSKRERYYFDADAIAETSSGLVGGRFGGGGHDVGRLRNDAERARPVDDGTRNRRSVWTVATQPFKEAHFATFPPDLIEPCIKAGCPAGGTVLDPFAGAGTTGLVADRLQRNAILIELNPAYSTMAQQRIHSDAPLFAESVA